MISQRWRRQRRCSPCIRSWTASWGKCRAARVMRHPIRLASLPYNDSFLEYHTERKWLGNLRTQSLSGDSAGKKCRDPYYRIVDVRPYANGLCRCSRKLGLRKECFTIQNNFQVVSNSV